MSTDLQGKTYAKPDLINNDTNGHSNGLSNGQTTAIPDRGSSSPANATNITKNSLRSKRTDITMAEVASHNTLDDIWICISGQAYNITPYVGKHPGGVLPLENLAG
jgi:cytochrome b involved in lipid metabolism